MLEIIGKYLSTNEIESFLSPAISTCKLLMSQLNDIADQIYYNNFRNLKLLFCNFDIRELVKDCIEIIKS